MSKSQPIVIQISSSPLDMSNHILSLMKQLYQRMQFGILHSTVIVRYENGDEQKLRVEMDIPGLKTAFRKRRAEIRGDRSPKPRGCR